MRSPNGNVVRATSKNLFMVTLMQSEDIYNFKKAADTTLISKDLKISKAKWIIVRKDSLTLEHIQTRESLNDMEVVKSTSLKIYISEEIIKNMT